MEAWQKLLVMANFHLLILHTTCGASFLELLRRTGIISQLEQKQILSTKKNYERAMLFYQILVEKNDAYDVLLEALEETQQTDALKIFTQNYNGLIDYNTTEIIGKGAYKTAVYNGLLDNKKAAIKVIHFSTKTSYQEYSLRELEMMKKLGENENILCYYFAEQNNSTLLFAMELCSTNLENWVHTESTDAKKHEICQQITKGVAYMHKMNILHRDLKPSNVLLTENGLVKIGDVGLSKRIPSQTLAGKGCWMAPEVLLERSMRIGLKMTSATDMFSLGCILYYVFTNGDHPFGGLRDQEKNIREYRPQILKQAVALISPKYLSLIKEMIEVEPSKRPSAVHVLMLLSKQFNVDLLKELFLSTSKRVELRHKGTSRILMGYSFLNEKAILLIDMIVEEKSSVWKRYFSSLNLKPRHTISACIHGNYLNILKFLFEMKSYQKEIDDDILVLATYFGNCSTINLVFTSFQRITGRNGISVGKRLGECDITRDIIWTPLKIALIRGDKDVTDKVIQLVYKDWLLTRLLGSSSRRAYDILETSAEVGNTDSFNYILDRYCPQKRTFLKSTFILHNCVNKTHLENAAEIKSRIEIVKLLLTMEPNLVKVKYEGKLPMEMDKVHKDILGIIGTRSTLVSKNLISNFSGQGGFTGWEILGNGGDGWKVEKNPEGADPVPEKDFLGIKCTPDVTSCFVSSYATCSMETLINLNNECKSLLQKPLNQVTSFEVICGQMVASRFDIGGTFDWEVKLLDKNHVIIDKHKVSMELPASRLWKEISHSFKFNDKSQKDAQRAELVQFYISGKDLRFWAGHYGPKFARSTVIFKVIQ